MKGLALVTLDARDSRQSWRGEEPKAVHEERRCILAPDKCPRVLSIVPGCVLDGSVELDVFVQTVSLRNALDIFARFRSGRESLFPVPFVEEFLVEGLCVGERLRVESTARVAIPVPGSSKSNPASRRPTRQVEKRCRI